MAYIDERYDRGLLTIREAAARLHVHPNTLRDWDRRGLLKATYRVGTRRGWDGKAVGDRRYDARVIDQYLAKHQTAQPQLPGV